MGKINEDDEMLPEYDFSGGVRGKHHKAYRRGHSVTIHKQDGTTETQHFTLADGAIMLDPDVRAYFPDDGAVNQALRTLIQSGMVPSAQFVNLRWSTTGQRPSRLRFIEHSTRQVNADLLYEYAHTLLADFELTAYALPDGDAR